MVASLFLHTTGVTMPSIYPGADVSSKSTRLFISRTIFSHSLGFPIPNSHERQREPDWLSLVFGLGPVASSGPNRPGQGTLGDQGQTWSQTGNTKRVSSIRTGSCEQLESLKCRNAIRDSNKGHIRAMKEDRVAWHSSLVLFGI